MDEHEWSRRRRSLKAAEIMKAAHLTMIQTIIGSGATLEIRTGLLMAFMLRARHLMRSLEVLATESLMEEMWCLLRSFSELVVDACYLYISSEQEIANFINYDSIAMNRYMRLFEEETKLKQQAISDPHRELLQRYADKAAQISNLKSNASSWTSTNTIDKAKAIDAVFKPSDSDQASPSVAFQGFVRSVFGSGHAYAHPSYSSLMPYMATLQESKPLESPQREDRVDHVLSGGAHCLYTFGVFVNEKLSLNAENYFLVTANLMKKPI